MPDILHQLHVSAPVEAVYASLASERGVRAWWTRDATLQPVVGGAGEFGFHDRRVVSRLGVEVLDPPRRVVWRTLSSNAPGGWDGTTIAFDLAADRDGTILAFAHRGFADDGEGYRKVVAGWAHYLGSLKAYLETGAGDPHSGRDA